MTPPTGIRGRVCRLASCWARDKEGYATVVVLGCITAVVAIVVAFASAAALVCDHHRAQVAADMAAYSAAFAHALGEAACPQAEKVAELNRGVVMECSISDGDVTVGVQVRTRTAHARAGSL